MRIPDFFIVGAPKCGTTALYSYLSAHPGVFMPTIKEPHYFSRDLPGRRRISSEDEYARLFADVPPGLVAGEASASYLFSKVAIDEILRLNPKARLIAVLRNPIDMAYSLHAERLRNLSEDVAEFETAWALQDERRKGRFLSKHPEPKMLQYRQMCSFGDQIERLFERTPQDQRAVYIFEEFEQEPERIYMDILKFLRLPADGRSEFPRVNPNRAVRRYSLARFHRMARKALKKRAWYAWVKAGANGIGIHPSHIINRWCTAPATRPLLRHEFRRQLSHELKDDVCKVERLLNRRLHYWKDWDRPGLNRLD